MTSLQEAESKLFGTKGMLFRSDKYSQVYLKHIPFMINDDEKIVCMPNTREICHSGAVGATGTGKGIFGNSLLVYKYWMNRTPSIILNDYQKETHENSLPCINNYFMGVNKMFHVNPTPLPIVYVHPYHKELNVSEDEEPFPHINISLPTRLIIQQIEKFFKLDKSARYVTGYIERFQDCKDIEEIEEVIDGILDEKFPDKKDKGYEEMKFKIVTTFKNIFDEKIVQGPPEAHSFLTVRRKETSDWPNRKGLNEYYNYSIQSLIAAGFIPSIQTGDICDKYWFTAYMAFVVKSLFDDKFKDVEFFKNNNLFMYTPEIDKMWVDRHNPKLIKDSLGKIGTNGRTAGIEFCWDSQNYDIIPKSIRDNTKNLIVMNPGRREQAAGIQKDYSVDKGIVDQMLKLETKPKQALFECIALTRNEYVIYNPSNGRTSYSREPQKGRLLPPLSQHKVPGIGISEVLEQMRRRQYR